MWRWLLAIFVALIVLDGVAPWLRKLGLGRLPGDMNFRLLGRNWSIPLGSTVLLSVAVSLIVRLL
ncbi:MAG: DUF2905 domain-containing protein [Ottowia sp.]|nr:DUF2905 domain-containing protein [Ottowia sp.]